MHSFIRVQSAIKRIATTTNTSSFISQPHRLFTSSIIRTAPTTLKQDLKELWGISQGDSKTTMSTQQIPNRDIPKHEMVYFKGLANSTRGFGEFRRVLFTGLYSQVVVMEVPVGGEIGDEVHTVDQILVFTGGRGLATVAGKDQEVEAGDVVVVPAGTQHQFVTRGDKPLELITVYSPAEHLPTTVHENKEIGDKEEDEGIDEAPAWTGKSKKENEDAGLVKVSGKYDE